MANNRVRFANNNQVSGLDASNITSSSELANFPFSNSQSDARYRVWKPAGNFVIDSTNLNIYINDGGDKTVAITTGSYTYTTLATEIATRLNVSSSGWSAAYSTTTRKFTISNSGSVTLRETQTTNAAWDTLGYTDGTDHAGTSFEADESRNHTSESVIYDLASSKDGTFIGVVGQAGETFTISSQATITIKANSINDFSSPPFTQTLSRTDDGILAFLDSTATQTYRWWEFEFEDRENTVGPEGFVLSYIYLGDYDTLTSTNIGTGFAKSLVDRSTKQTSDSGSAFFREKSKFWTFKSMQIQNLTDTERLELEAFFLSNGISTTFFLSIDPGVAVSTTINDLTKYCRFSASPSFANVIRDIYTMSFEIEEVV